ncbi:MAG: MFS transporter, partial [Thermoflexales bacterium]
VCGMLLVIVERRAEDPILPVALFSRRLFLVASGHGLLAGWAMFGSLSFIPLFVQAVLGTSATEAGSTLAPMMLGWVIASILGGRLLLSVSFRRLAVVGMVTLVAGSLLLSLFATSQLNIMIFTGLMGTGMGLSVPAFLIAMQSSVERGLLGTATSTLQFSRSIGGALGVNVMGAALATGLAQRLSQAGLDPAAVRLESLLDPLAQTTTQFDGALRTALGGALQSVFVIGFAAAVVGLAVTALAPGGRVTQMGRSGSANSPSAEPLGLE